MLKASQGYLSFILNWFFFLIKFNRFLIDYYLSGTLLFNFYVITPLPENTIFSP